MKKVSLTILVILVILVNPGYTLWTDEYRQVIHFSESSGVFTDSSNHAGLVLNGAGASWTSSGKFGGGIINSEGTSSLANGTTNSLYAFTTSESFSVSIWILADNPGANYRRIVSKGTAGGSGNYDGFMMRLKADGYTDMDICASGTCPYFAGSTTRIDNGAWHYLVLVRNITADTVSLYIDGNLEGSVTDTTTQNILSGDNRLWLGRYSYDSDSGGGEYWKGKIDEFRVIARALSIEEIDATYHSGSDEETLPPEHCWTYTASVRQLWIPIGCLYYTNAFSFI